MSLNKLRKNLNKATAVAAVIGIATCVFPAIAQAQATPIPSPISFLFPLIPPVPASGSTNVDTNTSVNFSLDPSVQDTNPDLNVGQFPGAIQNFTDQNLTDGGNPNINLSPLFFASGNLTTSRLTTDTNGKFPGLSFGYEAFIDYTTSRSAFNNDGLRYDVTFPGRTETLTLFIPSNDSNLINSLSGFTDLLRSNQIQAVVSRPDIGIEEKIVASNQDSSRRALTFVPEPNATASLLGVGALGAVALLKRNKRLSKSV